MRKTIVRFFFLLLAVLMLGRVCFADDVKKGKDGMFWQKLDAAASDIFIYQVDSIAQQCYAIYIGSGMDKISCKDLAKRKEWSEIIKWE